MHLDALCDDDGWLDYMRAPWRVGPWRCSSDGMRLLASLDDIAASEASPPQRELVATWLGAEDEIAREEIASLRARMGRPLLPVACPECHGEGALGNAGWDGAADDAARRDVCWLCDDAGCVSESEIARGARVGSHVYDCRQIAWLLAHAEGDVVSVRQSGDALVLRWHDGAGVISRCTSVEVVVETWGAP